MLRLVHICLLSLGSQWSAEQSPGRCIQTEIMPEAFPREESAERSERMEDKNARRNTVKKRKLKLFRAPQIRNIGKAGERQPTKRILLKTVCKGGAHQGVIASVKDCSSGSSEMQPNATSRYNTEVAFYQKLKFLILLVQNDQFLAIEY